MCVDYLSKLKPGVITEEMDLAFKDEDKFFWH